ncbi:MAG: DUF3592 domain-containing protein, partial [Anaerolineales bacterium]|nr:DUF3592 domain-containing protein [Anaerolineales bacterium]
CLYIGLRNRQRARESAGWPNASDALLSFKITKGTTKHRTYYYPHLEYEYTVNGTRYTGKRISFGYLAYDSEDEAKSDIERRVGKTPATVYYDPKHPKDAVLIRDATSGSVGLIIIGIVLIVTPILLGLYFLLPR